MTGVDLAGVPDLLTAGDADARVAAYLTDHLHLLSDGRPCPPTAPPRAEGAASGWMVYSWDVACPPGERRSVASDLLLAENPTHMHFARADLPGGAVAERVLSQTEPRWDLPTTVPRGDAGASAGPAPGPLAAVNEGIRAALGSASLLAFLTALLLLARTPAELAMIVAALALAQSTAVGLAAAGVLAADGRAIGAVVAFSVALAAAEDAWMLGARSRAVALGGAAGLAALALLCARGAAALGPSAALGLGLFAACHLALLDGSAQPARLRAGLAFAFGLPHGTAAVSAIAADAATGGELAARLALFNGGLLLAEGAVAFLLWPLLRRAGRMRGGRGGAAAEALSGALCGLGLYWLATRTFG